MKECECEGTTRCLLCKAAPDLYKACQLAIQYCSCSVIERESGHTIGCYAIECLAAVKKAGGVE